ncbi:hypothetical protein BC828DRAFT_46929 [Blastocladiella britannica]|nr:hypothetical protein BC828DRAFT_46929 [Blastocladiella britannica]
MVRERLHVGPPSRLHSEFSDNPATVPSPVAAARLASVRPPTPPVSISTPRSMSPLVGHLADDLENAFPLESLPLLHHHHHSPSPMLLMAKSSSSSTSTPQSRREGARTPIGSEIAPSDPALSPVSSLGSPPAPLRDRTPSLSSSLKRQRHVRSFLTGSPNGGIVATAPRRSSRRGSAPRMSTASTFGADLSDSDALDLSEDEEDCVAWDVSAADARLSYTDVRDNVVVDAGVNDADDDDCHPTPCHCDAHDRDCSDGPCTTRALYMECTNASCGLGVACRNRRIQRREYARVRVFRTEVKGFGVMADHAPIPTGTFVTEYRGELINGKSLKRRYGDPSVPAPPRLAPAGAALATRSRQQQPNQQSHLDAGAHRPGYVVWIEDDGYIDAGTHGSVARFTNHSCNPNCAIEKWIVDGSYRLVLKTLRDVALGEELTWNYGSHYGGAGKLICKCGADTCAGVIGGAEVTGSFFILLNALTADAKQKKTKNHSADRLQQQQQQIARPCAKCVGGVLVSAPTAQRRTPRCQHRTRRSPHRYHRGHPRQRPR